MTMTNKYLLTVDGDPVVICNSIEQAVTYIMWDNHLNKAFKDWYEEEKDIYGGDIEYQEYIKSSIQNGDMVRLETVSVLNDDTPPKEKKKYLIHDDDEHFLGVALTEDQAKLLFWLNDKNIICPDFNIDKVTDFSFEEF